MEYRRLKLRIEVMDKYNLIRTLVEKCTILIQIHSISQNLITQTLPTLITSQTKEIKRMTQIALGKASHTKLFRMLIVNYVFNVIATILVINQKKKKKTEENSAKHSRQSL